MKTAKEVEQDWIDRSRQTREARIAYGKQLENYTPEMYADEDRAERLRRALQEERYLRLSGVACDHCGNELVTDGCVLTSSPPQYPHSCPGCGAVFNLHTRG